MNKNFEPALVKSPYKTKGLVKILENIKLSKKKDNGKIKEKRLIIYQKKRKKARLRKKRKRKKLRRWYKYKKRFKRKQKRKPRLLLKKKLVLKGLILRGPKKKVQKRLNAGKEKKKRENLKKKIWYGRLNILFKKFNIFCTLVDKQGFLKLSISSGYLGLKGRRRRGAMYAVNDTAKLIVKKILSFLNLQKKLYFCLTYKIKGSTIRKKRTSLFKHFKKTKKIKFLKIYRPGAISHNGCRPRKKRRK